HPLSNVEDVFNAIFVSGNALGDAMFYGRGAGKLPTASAVVADIIDIVKHTGVNLLCVWNKPDSNNMIDPSSFKGKFFVRIKYSGNSSPEGFIEKAFKEMQTVLPHKNKVNGEIAFITPIISEKDLEDSLSSLKKEFNDLEVVNILRILE
ncbi:MAG TPA: homoserine dehydrogenase, partial [Clostridia bacterium]